MAFYTMLIAIDRAARLVIPKAIREAMGMTPGSALELTFTGGRIEIELAPAPAHVETADGPLPRVVADEELPPLVEDDVRTAIESTRR